MAAAIDSDDNLNTESNVSLRPRVPKARVRKASERGRRPKDGERPVKRHRIGLACEECRERKVKCDGLRPTCTTCIERNGNSTSCKYQPDRTKVAISQGYIEQLEKRINQLEECQSVSNPNAKTQLYDSVTTDSHHPNPDNRSMISTLSLPQVVEPRAPGSNPDNIDSQAISPWAPTSNQQVRSSPHSNLTEAEINHNVDAMGTVYSSEGGLIGQGAYSSSSSASFMNQVREAVVSKARTLSNEMLPYGPYPSFPIQEPKHREMSFFNTQQCVLPSRRIANQLMDVYWSQINVIYPFLEKTVFTREYEALWTDQGQEYSSDESMTFCILNVVFALSSQISQDTSIDQREASASIYFARASSLLQIGSLEHTSRRVIQALLLMGLYLQSTDGPDGCWAVVGLAIRIAQGIGLHMKDASRIFERQSDIEMARRIWHGCVLMDRTLSMSFGRPLMISRRMSYSVPYPVAVDDEFLSSKVGVVGLQPQDRHSRIEFFISAIKLSSILEDVLSTFYTPLVSSDVGPDNESPSALNPPEIDFNSIIRLDNAMTAWHESLPKYLVRPPSPTSDLTDSVFARQANILQLRLLHLQVLLFRPVLSYLLRIPQGSQSSQNSGRSYSLEQSIAVPCANRCVSAAQQTIKLFEECETYKGAIEPLPSWWYKTFYTYTAATVLIAGRIYHPMDESMTDDSLKASWVLSLTMLKKQSINNKSARRCLAALEFLDKKFVFQAEPEVASNQQNGSTTLREAQLSNMCPPSPQLSQDVIRSPEDDFSTIGDFADLRFQDFGWQDFSWLQSVPTDLLQFETENLF